MKRIAIVVFLVVLAVPAAAEQAPARRRRPPPPEYGRVVIANHSQAARLPPVVFDHWIHRAQYTCRLCHVDLGFAMKAGETDVRAADNQAGQYCGACHNGRTTSQDGKRLFEACAKATPADTRATCDRCHSQGKDVRQEVEFTAFTRRLPRERFGNGVDWEKAEVEKLIHLTDFLEGVSIRRQIQPVQKDFALSAKLEGMPNILFSHAKHTTWNGCELCHPDIFKVRRGTTRNSMVQIFEGQSCGTCHTSVAFPLIACQRCHTQPVQAPAPAP
jgi:c(7)-type cytochrome triheme protein